MDGGGKRFCPSVFRSLEMVMAKSEARRDPTAYFRAARPWPSLITALGLGYYAVGLGVLELAGRSGPCLSEGWGGVNNSAHAHGGCLDY